MDILRRKIERVMVTDAPFSRLSPVSVLTIVSMIYGAVVKLRAGAYRSGRLISRKLPCKVISIGNITTGGTGKTPMTLYLAEWLQRSGWRTAVVSRGYKGGAEENGGIVSDGRKIILTCAAAGDEPYLLASRLLSVAVPVVVGRKRYDVGMLAVKHFKPDVIILDDAFQHLQLSRDIDLVLLDCRRPFGNSYLLPRGTLREPVSALSRGDIFILTRAAPGPNRIDCGTLPDGFLRGRPLYRSVHVPELVSWIEAGRGMAVHVTERLEAGDTKRLTGRRVFAFAGIADNSDFKKTVQDLNCDLRGFMGFADHHRYTDRDVAALLHAARQSGADLMCTTEKDAVRMASHWKWTLDLAVIGVRISFGSGGASFEAEITKRLGIGRATGYRI
ncbi:MAG: tetraacyldisaccharide 4'-kinase [Desulfobacterales bacterium]